MKKILHTGILGNAQIQFEKSLKLAFPDILIFQVENSGLIMKTVQIEQPDVIAIQVGKNADVIRRLTEKLKAQSETKNIPLVALFNDEDDIQGLDLLLQNVDAVLSIPLKRWETVSVINLLFQKKLSVQRENELLKSIKQSEDRWQFALEGSGQGVWDWDLKKNKVFFSNQWKSMLGYEADDIKDELSEWESRVHPDDLAKTYADVQKHLNGETPIYKNEHRLRCKDGTYRWILDMGKIISYDEQGRPARFIGTHTDITTFKLTEKALKESEERYRLILDNSLDAIFLTSPDGTIYSANKAACELFGMTEEEICRVRRENFVDMDDPNLPVLMDERERTGKAKGELRFKRKDGALFQAEISSALYYNSNGELRSSMVIRDISERKKAEDEIKATVDELERFNRLMVGREIKMMELKKEVNELLEKLGLQPKYQILEENTT